MKLQTWWAGEEKELHTCTPNSREPWAKLGTKGVTLLPLPQEQEGLNRDID